ncbi:basic form of pathogenesis-related protein 1-like [Mercurialis annua]|uniref:basic form of pathogenesis-related protein 1-like n=1 Tax=Mercurialis annua TaxID=3986 RepID=UPI00215ED2D6|nr:basic form of pathogenesis-related protein 1-like [Mercurialis annua]
MLSKILLALFSLINLALILPSTGQNTPQDFLNAHNAARRAVGAGLPAMSWDNNLAAYARNYANQRINDCALEHSSGPYGENIAWGRPDLLGTAAVKLWVDEKAFYNYNANSCAPGEQCGHYTQVVWRNSVRLGCARVKCTNGAGTFITCNYDPPGNFIGERPYNNDQSADI